MSYVVHVHKEIFVFIYFFKGYTEIQNKQLALKKKYGSISAIFNLDVISATEIDSTQILSMFTRAST